MKPLRLLPLVFLFMLTTIVPAFAADPVLPVIEVPATAGDVHDAPLMIFLTGDGGWAAFVREISTGLAADRWAIVGLDMREYLWTRRTAEETAAAVDQLIVRYSAQWHRDRLIVAGFSRGADLAPFIVNRLPAATRSRVNVVVMLSPGRQAGFEFHVADLIRKESPADTLAVAEEVARLGNTPVLVLRGDKDDDALDLPVTPGRVITLPGDHHLGRDYPTIIKLIKAAYHAQTAHPSGTGPR